ncbi:isomerase [Pullulanibacillus camelliae]|uniref:Isomerase n=1 Tax=Pullulanibacillus camelliae TaxID=1707096 RepID=A0A8J2VLR2_9BACL|nr:mandelate racemase/muconate lactonizing enzyme family protein [Pullulanibacillus camelliae]GGE31444.1 isomerase [Pullulanibacillus camelliae]
MKITSAETFIIKNPLPDKGGDYWYLIKLTTDDGVVGWGEANMHFITRNPVAFRAMFHDMVDQYVIGQDPFKVELMWQNIFHYYCYGHADLPKMTILTAVETACWDIIGKALDKPIYELLGGLYHERLRSYTYLYPENEKDLHRDLWKNPEACAERALYYCEQGFNAIKLDPVLDFEGVVPPWQPSLGMLARAEKTIRLIREAVGDRCDIIIGTHGQYTGAAAIRFAKRMEKYDPLWFEEPLPPENFEQMARLNEYTSIPICTGERLATKFELIGLLTSQAADILQIDLGSVGGILESKKIAGAAEAFHAQITPHFHGGPIMYGAQAQISACSPNFLIQEIIEKMNGFHQLLVKQPFEFDEGYMIPSKLPGLGIELNEAELQKYMV